MVKWFAHQVSLEELDCDVLILLDCCTAGGVTGDAPRGLKEIIAACGFETWAPGVGEHSFTKSLIDELRQQSERFERPMTASYLHQRVLERLKSWSPLHHAQDLRMQDEA